MGFSGEGLGFKGVGQDVVVIFQVGIYDNLIQNYKGKMELEEKGKDKNNEIDD